MARGRREVRRMPASRTSRRMAFAWSGEAVLKRRTRRSAYWWGARSWVTVMLDGLEVPLVVVAMS